MAKSIKVSSNGLTSFTVTNWPACSLAVISLTFCTCVTGIDIGLNVMVFEFPPAAY